MGYRHYPLPERRMTAGREFEDEIEFDICPHIRDEDIIAALEQHDDPDRPTTMSIREARTILADIQSYAERYLGAFVDRCRAGEGEILYDGSVMVFAFETEPPYDDHPEEIPFKSAIEDSLYKIRIHEADRKTVIKEIHRIVADRYVEVTWGDRDPYVVNSPRLWRYGQDYFKQQLLILIGADLTAAEAVDYLMVEKYGSTQARWAESRGVKRQTVSDRVNNAREKLEDLDHPWRRIL